MNRELLDRALSEIDPAFVDEAALPTPAKHRRRLLPVVLIAAALTALLSMGPVARGGSGWAFDTEYTPPRHEEEDRFFQAQAEYDSSAFSRRDINRLNDYFIDGGMVALYDTFEEVETAMGVQLLAPPSSTLFSVPNGKFGYYHLFTSGEWNRPHTKFAIEGTGARNNLWYRYLATFRTGIVGGMDYGRVTCSDYGDPYSFTQFYCPRLDCMVDMAYATYRAHLFFSRDGVYYHVEIGRQNQPGADIVAMAEEFLTIFQ